MRVLYKALASVGMLALSTVAALGVRHLTIASKKRKQANENEPERPGESPIHEVNPVEAHKNAEPSGETVGENREADAVAEAAAGDAEPASE